MSVKDEKPDYRLEQQHRHLDTVLLEMRNDLSVPDEYVTWLKRRKLMLKDKIQSTH